MNTTGGLVPEKSVVDMAYVFGFLKRDMPDPSTLSREQGSLLAQELAWRAMQAGAVSAIKSADNHAWFGVMLNNVQLQLPGFTIKTMVHCVVAHPEPGIRILIEESHWRRMYERLRPGSVFLDVGAATGAMTVPFAKLAPDVRIVAFEPSVRTRAFLSATLERNGLEAEVLPYAVSDQVTTMRFLEFPEDESGVTPFLPEASRIEATAGEHVPGTNSIEVPVRTLDSLMGELRLDDVDNMVVKIDVEGFETHVLRGASSFIEKIRPFFSIDIHVKPGESDTTEADVVSILSTAGYKIEKMGHVILALP